MTPDIKPALRCLAPVLIYCSLSSVDAAMPPACCRNSVHVIFVDSPIDFAHIGGFDDLAQSVQRSGFRNVYFFNPYKHRDLAGMIRRIKSGGSDRKIVLVGWSSGSLIARKALNQLRQQGIGVHSVINLDSFVYREVCRGKHPRNVGRYVMIYRNRNKVPTGLHNVAITRIGEWNHLAVPKNPRTRQAIMAELYRLCRYGCNSQYHKQQALARKQQTGAEQSGTGAAHGSSSVPATPVSKSRVKSEQPSPAEQPAAKDTSVAVPIINDGEGRAPEAAR